MTRATTWMSLKDIVPSEIRHSPKDKYRAILLARSTQRSQIRRDRKSNGGCQRLVRAGEWGVVIQWV